MSLILAPLDGRVDLKGLLGEGGMGQVYRAWDGGLERAVAVKFVRGSDPREAERLLLEARLQARVEHPGVVRVHEVGTLEGRPCIVMQLVEGGTLADLEPGTPLAVKVRLLREAAEGLHAAHLQGLVHRDVKPGNILVEQAEGGGLRALVSDFGLARDEDGGLTRSGLPAGTLDFMAPEVLLGSGPVDFRVDLYSLGASAYAVLSGRLPFRLTTVQGTAQPPGPSGATADSTLLLRRMLEGDPAPLTGLPADLRTIVAKAMEKAPGDRYPSAEAFAEDLGRFQRGEPVQARPPTLADRLVKGARRNPLAARASLAAALAVLLGLGWAVWTSRRASQEALEATRLGAEAQDLDQGMVVEQLLPPHDLRPFLAKVRAALGAVDRQRRGRADGPAAYFKGRAHQLLGEQSAALSWLRRAWELGDRRPEVAIALSAAESDRYFQERNRTAGLEGKEAKARFLATVQREWRDPALARLAAIPLGKDALSRLARARIAFMEDRYPEAAALARAVADEDPSRLDARELSLLARFAQSRNLYESGQRGEAATLALAALEEGGAALGVARSSLALRVTQTRLHLLWGIWDGAAAMDAAHLDAAEGLIAEARRLNPDDPLLLATQSAALRTRSVRLYSHGQDAVPTILAAVDLAERATRADPASAFGWGSLSQQCMFAATLLGYAGQEVGPHLTMGIEAARKAVALRTEDWVAMATEVELLLLRAKRAQADGQPGDADLDRVTDLVARLVAEGGMPRRVARFKGKVLWFRGLAGAVAGRDPWPDFAQGWAALGALRAADANDHTSVSHALDLLNDWGAQALAEDRLEGVPFAEGEAWGRALVAATPGNAVHGGQLGQVLVLSGVAASRQHRPHEARIREGEALLRGLADGNAAQAVRRVLANGAAELAWTTRAGPDRARALDLARACVKGAPGDAEGQVLLASALLLQGEQAQGPDRGTLLQAAAEAAGKAIQGGHRGPVPFALRGRALEGQVPGSGQADLAEARRMNPRLRLLRPSAP